MWALYEVLADLPIGGLGASGLCVTGGTPKTCVGGLGADSLVAWVVLAPELSRTGFWELKDGLPMFSLSLLFVLGLVGMF
jgi:hypothetical protein